MKIGIASWTFEALPLKDVAALSKALGFERMDIAGFVGRGRCSCNPFEAAAQPDRQADRLLRELEPFGMSVPDYFPQPGATLSRSALNDPDAAVRSRNREMLEGVLTFCKLAGIPGITLSPGVNHPHVPFERNVETSAAEFAWLAERAASAGITVRVEPHAQAIADTPERIMYILERAPGVKVTLDYAHFLLQYIEMDRIHKLLPFTDHVHVRQARMGKLQTRTEEGIIDYADIAARLKKLDYQGVFSLEYVHMDWYDCNQVDCIQETLKTKAILESALQGSTR